MRSIRTKLMLPLLIAALAVGAVGAAVSYRTFVADLEAAMLDRAELLTNAVTYAAERTSQEDLVRIVQALGGESDVALILVVEGDPPAVVASTRNKFIDRPLAELPEELRGELEAALRDREPITRRSEGGREFRFSKPLLTVSPTADRMLTGGGLLVHLDTAALQRELASSARRMAASVMGTALLIATATYLLVDLVVVRPVRSLTSVMDRRAAGDAAAHAPAPGNDEVGRMAAAFNEMVRREDEQGARTRAIVEGVAEAIITLDPHDRIESINAAGQRMFGYDPADLVGRPLAMLLPGLQRPGDDPLATSDLQTGRPVQGCRRDGRTLPLDLAVSKSQVGGRPRTICLLRDLTDRQRIEAALRERERRFRALAETSPSLVFQADRQGDFRYVNDRWEELTGRPVETSLRAGWTAALHPDDLEAVLRGWRSAVAGRLPWRDEFRFRHAERGEVWVLGQAEPEYDEREELAGYIGTCTDISRLRAAQEALRLTQFSVNYSEDAIFWMDLDGRFFDVNVAACESLGYSRDELLALRVPDIDGEPRHENWDEMRKHIRAAGALRVSGRHRRKDGGTFPVEVSTNYLEFGDQQFICAVVRDVSEREEAREREASLSRIVESALNEIYVFDIDSLRFLYVNRGAVENLGYSLEELRRMTPGDIAPEYTPERVAERLAPLRDGRRRLTVFATFHRRKYGSTYPVEVHLQLGSYESRPAFLAIAIDISERQQQQERLVQAERLAAIGEAMAGLSHESRNALQSAQASLEMLAEELDDRPAAATRLSDVQEAQDELHRLFEQVREYAAPIHVTFARCDLADIWREAWERLAPLRSGRTARLIEPAGKIDLVCDVDRFAIRQVFRNILENSLAACQDPVEITLASRDTELQGREALEISICDNGPGLDDEQQSRIFDSFYTTKARGTGLGMAIVRRQVEAHQGQIRVDVRRKKATVAAASSDRARGEGAMQAGAESDGRPGAAFTITLPRNQA